MGIFLVSLGLSHMFYLQLNLMRAMGSDGMLQKLGVMCIEMLQSSLLILIVPIRVNDRLKGQKPSRLVPLFIHFAWPLTIEGVRVLGQVMLWSLLFLIPGIVRFLRFILVPFVVLLDSKYQKEEVDALQQSSDLVKGHKLGLFVLVLFTFAFDFGFEIVTHFYGISEFPVWVVGFSLGRYLLNIFFYCLVFEVYRSLNQKLKASRLEAHQ